MNRTDFQELAVVRLQEAETLLDAGLFDGAFYLAGYAVECALKACIARQTQQYEFPERDRVLGSYSHDFKRLIIAATLTDELDAEIRADRQFEIRWNEASKWSPGARYERKTRDEAAVLIAAAGDPEHGVLQWLSHYW